MARIVEPCNWTGCWLRPFLRDLHIEAHPALAELAPAQSEMAYLMDKQPVRSVETDALCIAYVEHGPTNGGPGDPAARILHDLHAFDEVASILARAGARINAPYTRGSAQPVVAPLRNS